MVGAPWRHYSFHRDLDHDGLGLLALLREGPAKLLAEPFLQRGVGSRKLWREADVWRIPMDLRCYTPEEFRLELDALGLIGQAKRRGELIEIRVPRAA